MIIRSVACVRLEIREREFIGCGMGWTQEIEPDDTITPSICKTCGRKLIITGQYKVIDLKGIK